VFEQIGRHMRDLKADAAIKAVVLTGFGSKAFAAGADVTELARLKDGAEAARVALRDQTMVNEVAKLGKPVVAALNGLALGGGAELAQACTARIAPKDLPVCFGQPEVNLGIIPGWGGTQRLPRLIGKAKAAEWILTGDLFTAQEALRLGLVNAVVPQDQVLKAAKDLARKLALKSAVAVGQALQAIEAGMDLPLEEGLAKEAEAFGRVAASDDSKEGIRAFLEKRQPQFTDR
jgi:enoyl-CoA hydratase/carnithine racemase